MRDPFRGNGSNGRRLAWRLLVGANILLAFVCLYGLYTQEVLLGLAHGGGGGEKGRHTCACHAGGAGVDVGGNNVMDFGGGGSSAGGEAGDGAANGGFGNAYMPHDQAPRVYLVTETRALKTQWTDLLRTSQALLLASRHTRMHWIIVEPEDPRSAAVVSRLLARMEAVTDPSDMLAVTVLQYDHDFPHDPRDQGLQYLYELQPQPHNASVVILGNDRVLFDEDLFHQAATVRDTAVWPLSSLAQHVVTLPVVDDDGRVTGFRHSAGVVVDEKRAYPLYSASFAISMARLRLHDNKNGNNRDTVDDKEQARVHLRQHIDPLEDGRLLADLGVELSDIVPLGNNATDVLVWLL